MESLLGSTWGKVVCSSANVNEDSNRWRASVHCETWVLRNKKTNHQRNLWKFQRVVLDNYKLSSQKNNWLWVRPWYGRRMGFILYGFHQRETRYLACPEVKLVRYKLRPKGVKQIFSFRLCIVSYVRKTRTNHRDSSTLTIRLQTNRVMRLSVRTVKQIIIWTKRQRWEHKISISQWRTDFIFFSQRGE